MAGYIQNMMSIIRVCRKNAMYVFQIPSEKYVDVKHFLFFIKPSVYYLLPWKLGL